MKLGKNVFLALASVGVRGPETPNDELEGLEALAHAARENGIEGVELEEVKVAARAGKGNFADVGKLRLTPEERLFTYAIAIWLVRIDGVVMPEEKLALMKLGDALNLADGDRTNASAASFKVSQLDPSERPQRFDLGALADGIRVAFAGSLKPPPPA